MSSSPETGMPPRNRQSALRQRVWKGAVWIMSAEIVMVVVRLGTLMVLARLLTPTDFGIMSAALVAMNFTKIFLHMGVGPAIIQLPRLRRDHLSTGFTTSLAIGLGFQVLLWFSAPAMGRYFNSETLVVVLRVLSFGFPIRGMSVVAFSLLQRDLRFKEIAKINVSSFFIGHAVVGVGLAFLGAGAWALVMAYLVDIILQAMLYLFLRKPEISLRWSGRAFKEMFRIGSGITVAQMANYFASNGDNLVIGRLLGLGALGLYGRAYGIMSAAVLVSGGVLKKVLFPAISRVQDNAQRLRTAYSEAQSAVALSVLPVSAYLIALAPEVVAVLLGPKWVEVVPVFRILAAGLLFRTGHQIALSVAKGTGAVFRLAGVQIVYAVAVIGGALAGQYWGIEGVAVGVLAGMIFGYVAAARVALKVTSQRWGDFLGMHRSGIMLGITVFSLTFLIGEGLRWLGTAPWTILLVALIVVGVVAALWYRHTPLGPLGSEILRALRLFLAEKRTGLSGARTSEP